MLVKQLSYVLNVLQVHNITCTRSLSKLGIPGMPVGPTLYKVYLRKKDRTFFGRFLVIFCHAHILLFEGGFETSFKSTCMNDAYINYTVHMLHSWKVIDM